MSDINQLCDLIHQSHAASSKMVHYKAIVTVQQEWEIPSWKSNPLVNMAVWPSKAVETSLNQKKIYVVNILS